MGENPELRIKNGTAANLDILGNEQPDLIAGPANLTNMQFLSNEEKFKTVLLNGYLQDG